SPPVPSNTTAIISKGVAKMVRINRSMRTHVILAAWLASALLLVIAVAQEPSFIVPAPPRPDPVLFDSTLPEPIGPPAPVAADSQGAPPEAETPCGNGYCGHRDYTLAE